MFTVISRIVHYGVKNFWRNGWLSTTTVIIMILCLSVAVGLIMFNVVTTRVIASVENKIDISVYFKTNSPEDQILSLKQSLENLSEVKAVDYISRDQALEIFKEAHKAKEEITQALSELGENPLEASLAIKAHEPDQYAAIASYLTASSLANLIDNVSYSENQPIIDFLNQIIKNVNRGGFALTLLMAFFAGLVVFNTVRLAIYSNRDEIGIMRVVGASNSLVRGPYVVDGVLAGSLAAIFSVILSAPIVYVVSPYLKVAVPGLDMFEYFYTNILMLFGYQLLFGILIGAFSSFVAVRRYLKN